ncbi:MAG TPA: PadR family transcriptional regulator [Microlunatus sp.]|nr:PadR family transcriptional regulator [Microlunatus sp.]
MRPMSLRHALLGVLAARPMTGYELSQFFDSSTGWVWSANHSQIYPLLSRMEDDGAIASEKQVRGTKLNRKSYSITPTGQAELAEWIATTHPTPSNRDPILIQALYFDMIDPDDAIQVLDRYIEEQEKIARESREHSKRLASKDTPLLQERLKNRPKSDHDRIATLKAHVFDGQASIAEARVEWARAERALLRAK